MVKVLFVCLGNICRSPLAEGSFRALIGIDLSEMRARRVEAGDYSRFDYLLAMDRDNYQHLSEARPPEASARLHLFLDFAPELGDKEVPDPYYGGEDGFERVLDMVEAASRGLLAEIRRDHL
jgi:protein-tyrosine phosphatase